MEEELEFEEEEEVEGKTSIFRKIFFIGFLILILLFIYAKYIGNTGLQLKEYKIVNEAVIDSFNGFRIVQFSDIYYGKNSDINSLKEVVKKINITSPDIVVFTGDLTDKITNIKDDDVSKLSLELAKIKSNYGNYYISGDNDINNVSYEKIMNDAKFKSLNDNFTLITNKNNESLLLAGINYKSTGEYLEELFKNNLPTYKILITHTPNSYDNISKYNFNLVLAGHTLGGQIKIPFVGGIYIPKEASNYKDEYYKFNQSELYISSGIGTDTMNYRLFNRPSFNLYKLYNK